jgi:hypothetical protein
VAFLAGAAGRPDRLFLHPLLPVGHFVFTFERLPPGRSRRVLQALEGVLLAGLAALALGLPAAVLRRRLAGGPAPTGSPLAALGAALIGIAHLAPAAALAACIGPAGLGALAEPSPPARALLLAGHLALVPVLLLLPGAVRPGPDRTRRRLEAAWLLAGTASMAAWGLLDPIP